MCLNIEVCDFLKIGRVIRRKQYRIVYSALYRDISMAYGTVDRFLRESSERNMLHCGARVFWHPKTS